MMKVWRLVYRHWRGNTIEERVELQCDRLSAMHLLAKAAVEALAPPLDRLTLEIKQTEEKP